ncbi:MAG: hypothetical protein ACRCYP_05715 [Alphaproteobacteria bacterium]
MIYIQFRLAILLSLLSLVGCSSYQESFDCPPGRGVGCKSVSEVDACVESGLLPRGQASSLQVWFAPEDANPTFPNGVVVQVQEPS